MAVVEHSDKRSTNPPADPPAGGRTAQVAADPGPPEARPINSPMRVRKRDGSLEPVDVTSA